MLTRLPKTPGMRGGFSAQRVCGLGTGAVERSVRRAEELIFFSNGSFFSCEFCPGRYSEGRATAQSLTMTDHNLTSKEPTAAGVRMTESSDLEGFPKESAWERTPALRFNADWRGKNADQERETEVRLLWMPETLFLRFRAKYRVITVFPDAEPDGRRDQLWDRDVAEVFLQPDASIPRRYKEFEVSPNGFWIDLDIAPGEKRDLKSGLQRRVVLNEAAKTWVAELALPMNCLVERFDPSATWRVNFYRVEGAAEPRFYSAWRPTGTAVPNFHVPEAFGELIFVEATSERK
jgi:alpha-galactosidase